MNSIRSRLMEVKRLSEANRKDAMELKGMMDFTSWLVFMASITVVQGEDIHPDMVQNFTAGEASP